MIFAHPFPTPLPINLTRYPSTCDGTIKAPSAGVTAVIVALVVISGAIDNVYDQVYPSISVVYVAAHAPVAAIAATQSIISFFIIFLFLSYILNIKSSLRYIYTIMFILNFSNTLRVSRFDIRLFVSFLLIMIISFKDSFILLKTYESSPISDNNSLLTFSLTIFLNSSLLKFCNTTKRSFC